MAHLIETKYTYINTQLSFVKSKQLAHTQFLHTLAIIITDFLFNLITLYSFTIVSKIGAGKTLQHWPYDVNINKYVGGVSNLPQQNINMQIT